MKKLRAWIDGFYGYRHLMQQLVEKDIKLKYRRSFLGYLWSILNPLMIMIIMVAVFSTMFRFDILNYPVYLITGQTIFNFVSEATNQAMWSITGNAALLKKTYVPKYIFTLSKVTSSCINTLFSLGALLIVCIVCKVRLNWYMLFIPVIMLQVYVFCVGLGMFLSQATVFFRDIQYIYAAVITAWMYLTPIFYPINQLPFELMWGIKHFNPLYSYITQFRTIILEATMPDPRLVLYGFAVSFAMLVIGTFCFFKNQDRFILYI
ncbi:ABC transporter permease [Enterocloster lavalensis]|uniref:Transport permease protein n=1 Tax=Enterocloster lavalensis TaxID=460384 RepID=A0A1I0HV91_9FIRM|nr:ABC transporter permease [Enterocloster lavalensis]SET87975.1 lipopolysaccharide transport system permease protein [Enterocloster lavalensis]